MDSVPTLMLAGNTAASSSAASAKQPAATNFAALLAMVANLDATDAAVPNSGKNQAADTTVGKSSKNPSRVATKSQTDASAKPADGLNESGQNVMALVVSMPVGPIAVIPPPAAGVPGFADADKSTSAVSPPANQAAIQVVAVEAGNRQPGSEGTVPETDSAPKNPSAFDGAFQNIQPLSVSVLSKTETLAGKPGNQPMLAESSAPQPAHSASSPHAADSSVSRLDLAHRQPNSAPEAPSANIQKVMATVTAAAMNQAAVQGSTSAATMPALHTDLKLSGMGATKDARVPNITPTDRPAGSVQDSPRERGKREAESPSTRPIDAAPASPTIQSKDVSTVGSTPIVPRAIPQTPQASEEAKQIVGGKDDSSPLPPGVAPTALPENPAQILPHAAGMVNSASLLEQAGTSELRVGVNMGELGNVEIRTQLDRQQLKTEILVDHHELSHAMTADLPALQQQLHDHDVSLSSLTLLHQSAGGSGGSQGGYRREPTIQPESVSESSSEKVEMASSPEEGNAKSGLDIRI